VRNVYQALPGCGKVRSRRRVAPHGGCLRGFRFRCPRRP